MPYDELLEWAGDRAEWQQDALRRIAQNGELTDEDIAELSRLVEQQVGLVVENGPDSVPLAAEHLSGAASNAPQTMLGFLGPTYNIDRLASDQPPIRFALNGITLIYGPNASGKSGYCRIAKQLCRSLSPVPLRGNVFVENAENQRRIELSYRVGDEGIAVGFTWEDGSPPPPELARISVFDSASARVYVDQSRRIEFLPYELDILNKLALACRALEEQFEERETRLDRSIAVPLPAGYTDGTPVQLAIAALSTETPIHDLPNVEVLRQLGTWTADHQARLETVEDELRNDPHTRLRLGREAKTALESIKTEVENVASILSDGSLANLRERQQTATKMRVAAEASARDLFEGEPIPEVGSDVWRQMLLYARDFSFAVFPDTEPPRISTAGICVLCQQTLDAAATARMAAFDNYLSGRAAEDSAIATRTLEEREAAVRALRIRNRRDIDATLVGYVGLSAAAKANAETIAEYLEKAAERLAIIKEAINKNTYGILDNLDALPVIPTDLIDAELAALDIQIAELEEVERDEDAIARLVRERAELTDRKNLSDEIEVFVERRNLLEIRLRVLDCKSQCRRMGITRHITNRRRAILTPSLQEALDNELASLQLKHIPLNLADRGQAGDSIVEISLSAAQRISNSEILSEGEQRALALACFFAELKEIGNTHGVIIDDPVSSLDHTRMDAVARRLALEAKAGRQVIIFTHNILFHSMIVSEARRAGVACHQEWMTSIGNERFGIIDDAQKPWHLRSVSDRLPEIERGVDALRASAYDHTDETCRPAVVELYTKMRTTWERTIEEVLFARVVQRFRPEIMTQRLQEACVDPSNDYPAIFEGMKRCSHHSGHDLAEDLSPELPSLEDIADDLKALKDFTAMALNRRAKLRKKDYEAGIAPEFLVLPAA